MNREQMIAWLTLEGYECKRYNCDNTLNYKFVVSDEHEWLFNMGEWEHLKRHPDKWEFPAHWETISTKELEELFAVIQRWCK